MRKISVCLFLSVLGLGILTAPVRAAETVAEATTETDSEVDYYLAYPGILPDHFLYPVKMLRDRILLFLTTDVLKKAQLYLLFADKRIGAARSLVEGGKEKLGVNTAFQAEEYLQKAVEQEKQAREKNRETNTFLEQLRKASQKHEEVLTQIQEKITQETRQQVENALQITQKNQEQLRQRSGQ